MKLRFGAVPGGCMQDEEIRRGAGRQIVVVGGMGWGLGKLRLTGWAMGSSSCNLSICINID